MLGERAGAAHDAQSLLWLVCFISACVSLYLFYVVLVTSGNAGAAHAAAAAAGAFVRSSARCGASRSQV